MATACSDTRAPSWRACLAALGLVMCAVLVAGPAPRASESDPEKLHAPSEASDYASRRHELRMEKERLRGQLERFKEEEQSLLARLERLRLESRLSQQELQGTHLERRRLGRELDRLGFQIDRLTETLERQKAALGGRLRALYRRGPLTPVRTLTSASSSAEWLRAVGLLEHQARRDAEAIASLRADTKELQHTRQSQTQALAQVELERKRAESVRHRLTRTLSEHQSLLEAVRNDQRTHRAAYEEITSAARELDKLISMMLDGASPIDVEHTWVSLGAFRGLLSWPVYGSLKLPFGDRKHPRFKTITPHRGLTFRAAEGAPVLAIFEGEVVFQDWLRGYGQTVILDHHHGYVSVYSHLLEPQVEPGGRVARGTVLGNVGESGSLEGPQLYFELRRDGLPLDPEPWLSRGPQRAAR